MFADLINMPLIYKINNNIFKNITLVYIIWAQLITRDNAGVWILKILEFKNGVTGGKIKELVPNMMKVDLEMSFLLKLLILINFLIN